MTNSAGAVTTAKLDLLAETAADGTVNVLDRDTSDFLAVTHSATSYSGIAFGAHTYGQPGNLSVGSKHGGEVEPLNSNIHDEPGGGQMRSKPQEDQTRHKNKKRKFRPL